MATSTHDGDLYVRGDLRANTMTLPTSSVGNTEAKTSDPFGVTKQRHQYHKLLTQVHGSSVAAERRAIHTARAAGEILSLRAGFVVAATGDSTATVVLRKNGTSIMSGTLQLDNANTAFAFETGTFTPAAYSADDVFEISVTVSPGSGTPGQGLFVEVVFDEAPG